MSASGRRHILYIYAVSLILFLSCTGNIDGGSIRSTPKSVAFPLEVLWRLDARGNLGVPPRYGDGHILVQSGSDTSLTTVHYAVDAAGGGVLWQYATDIALGYYEFESTVIEDKLILSGDHRVEGLDLYTGTVEWLSTGYNSVSSIAASDSTIFVSSKDWVTALDPATGTIKWRDTFLPGYTFRVLYDEEANRVIVPADKYYLIDPDSGSPLQTTEIDLGNGLSNCYRGLQVHVGRLYCESLVYDAMSGELLSAKDFDANDYLWLPLIVSDTLYLRTNAGTVKAVDTRTMTLKWEYHPLPGAADESPEIISNVAVLGSVGYAIADDATLRAFDTDTGNEIGWWQAPYVADWRTGTWVYVVIPGLVSDGERLYATFGDNTLYAFGP
jgi:outer membrane protein assembly factor BamB